MNTVTVEIDVTRPIGRKLVRELDGKKYAKVNYPLPDNISGVGYTLEESYNMVMDKMSKHYGVDVRKL